MKKLVLLAMLLVGNMMLSFAQDDVLIYIADCQYAEELILCREHHQRVLVYAQDGCETFQWITSFGTFYNESPLIVDPIQLNISYCQITYLGCMELQPTLTIYYEDSPIPSTFTHEIWKHQGEVENVEAVGIDSTGWGYWYEFQWNIGETTRTIDVTEPGTYSVEITGLCGSATRTFIVKDNVEISLATCDLESNLNMVTWPVTAAQAEYIDHIRVKRDGMEVGTANYSDGVFVDNIGSAAAARTYTLIAVATDGTECPIESYPKETIHMSYTVGVNNTIEVGWNTPTGYDLLGYNICEWHPGAKDGDLTVIDYVGASVNTYTCSESQFDHGMIVIQGVEAGKTESRLLSNRSLDYVGLGENTGNAFRLYPNPAQGRITVEGTGTMTVTNALGQTIMTKEIYGKESIELPKGLYFVKMGSAARKVVVE